jgi:hypothetical protein
MWDGSAGLTPTQKRSSGSRKTVPPLPRCPRALRLCRRCRRRQLSPPAAADRRGLRCALHCSSRTCVLLETAVSSLHRAYHLTCSMLCTGHCSTVCNILLPLQQLSAADRFARRCCRCMLTACEATHAVVVLTNKCRLTTYRGCATNMVPLLPTCRRRLCTQRCFPGWPGSVMLCLCDIVVHSMSSVMRSGLHQLQDLRWQRPVLSAAAGDGG